MAKAYCDVVELHEMVTKRYKQIQLYLNENEALILRDILMRVGGDNENSRRKYMNPIVRALADILGYGLPDDRQDIVGKIIIINSIPEKENK